MFSVYFLLLLEWFLYCLLLRGDLWFLCTACFLLGIYVFCVLHFFSWVVSVPPSPSWGSMVSMYCLLILKDLCFLCTSFLSGFCIAFFFLGINGFYVRPSYSWRSMFSVYFLLLLEWFLSCFLLPGDLLYGFYVLFSYSWGVYVFCVLPSSSWVVSVLLHSSSWGSIGLFTAFLFLKIYDFFWMVSFQLSSSLGSTVWFLCIVFFFLGSMVYVYFLLHLEWFPNCILPPGDRWFLCTAFFLGINVLSSSS